MVCRMVNVDKCRIMHEKERGKKDRAEICPKWRAGVECG